MFISLLAKCRCSSPWSLGSLQLCLQNAVAAPLGALDVYSYVCKMQGHFPLELCIFTARLAKCRGSSPWSFVYLQLGLQNAGTFPLGALYIYS